MTNRYGTEAYQKELLQFMKNLNAFCEKEEVRYSLAGGSLLGAIRHNGFIPWDDDLDIMLSREEYMNLIYLIGTISKDFKLVRDKWVVRIEYNDDRGVIGDWRPSVDLFINDSIPSNNIKYKTKVLAVKTLQGMMKDKVSLSDYSAFYRVCLWLTHYMGLLIPMEIKYKAYQYFSQIGNISNADYVAAFNDEFHLLTKKYSGKLMDSFEKHVFEDTEFWITKEYDNYLSVQYGNYMELPPEEKRVPLHLSI